MPSLIWCADLPRPPMTHSGGRGREVHPAHLAGSLIFGFAERVCPRVRCEVELTCERGSPPPGLLAACSQQFSGVLECLLPTFMLNGRLPGFAKIIQMQLVRNRLPRPQDRIVSCARLVDRSDKLALADFRFKFAAT